MQSIDTFLHTTSLTRYLREVPLIWFLLGLILAKLLTLAIPKPRATSLRRSAFAAGLFVLATYLAITFNSLRSFLIQQDEANIFSISAASLRAQPMYHPPISPLFDYSLMYGPLTFLTYRISLIAGGVHHFWIMRATVVLATLLVCFALFTLLRRFVSTLTAIALLAFPISVLLQHPEISLSTRGDIWIFLFATLAILSSYLESETLTILLTGICGGLIIDYKISAAPAILFPLLLLYRRFGLRAPALALVPLIATAFAPFALPNISLHNYIAWISFTRSEGLSPLSMFSNTLFALFLLSPVLVMELYARRHGSPFKELLPELAIILLCLLLAIATSKNGSGLHYLWHVVPSIVVYIALVAKTIPDDQRSTPIFSIAIACTLFTCAYIPRANGYVTDALMPSGFASAQQSINNNLDRYRNHSSLQMGYGSGDGDYRTALRYTLIYKGQPYTFEGNTGRFETRMLPFPTNVLNQMSTCKDDVWLIPHNEKPFALYIFPDVLRKTFLHNYTIDSTDAIYDVYVCHHPAPH